MNTNAPLTSPRINQGLLAASLVKGFVVVERDVAVYRTFDTGYEWSLYKACQAKSERMELVLQRQLNEGKADMRNTVTVKFDDPAKAVNTLAIAVFGVHPETAKVAQ